MSQNPPPENEEEIEAAQQEVREGLDMIESAVEAAGSARVSVEALGDISQQVTEAAETAQEIADSGQGIDTEVVEAIQQINSLESSGEVPDEPEVVAEQVTELYDGDRLAAMRELLEEHNLRIVQQLVASDTGALSPREVAFRNRGIISESTVRDHLRELAANGFVEKLEPTVDSIPNEMPRTFYAASPLAIELLKQMGLWENLGMLYQLYDSLERPEDIQQIEDWEHRPVPDWL